MKWIACMLLLLLAAPSHTAPIAPQAHAEIDGLLGRLGQSGCRFFRNGSWYEAGEAEAHLRRKYDYLRERAAVASAEEFIERAGTGSSVSGEAYRVRCGEAQPLPSAQWLGSELVRLRAP